MDCPYCDGKVYADTLDGNRIEPYRCDDCGAEEFHRAYNPADVSEVEKECGWYAPDGYCTECRIRNCGMALYDQDGYLDHYACVRCDHIWDY
jgi:hypothetical protein